VAGEVEQLIEPWHPGILDSDKPRIGMYFEWLPKAVKKKMDCVLQITMPKYLYSNVYNYLDIMIISGFFVLLSLTGAQSDACAKLNWNAGEEDGFVEGIYYVGTLQRIRLALFGVLLLLCWVKSMEKLMLLKDLALMVKVFIAMLFKLWDLIVIYFVIILAFATFSYVMYGSSTENQADFFTCVFHTFDGSIGNVSYDGLTEQSRIWRILYFLLFALILVVLVLNLIIAVMTEVYEEIRTVSSANWAMNQLEAITELAEGELNAEKRYDIFGIDLPEGWYYWIPNFDRRFSAWFMSNPGRHIKTSCWIVDEDDGDEDYDYTLLMKETRHVLLQQADWADVTSWCGGKKDDDVADEPTDVHVDVPLDETSKDDALTKKMTEN